MKKLKLYFVCFDCFEKEYPGKPPGLTSKDVIICGWCGKKRLGVLQDNSKEIWD